MIKIDYDNTQVNCEIHFKPGMIFNEAVSYTLDKIRKETNKDFVLPLSGGADSLLISYICRDNNIDVKRIHQRYYYKGDLINKVDNSYIHDIDEYQDVDVEEFQKTDFFLDTFVNKFPTPVHCAIQPYVKFACNENKDFVLSPTTPLSVYRFSNHKEPQFCYNPMLMYRTIGLGNLESSSIFNDNPYIVSSWFDDMYFEQVQKMNIGKWEDQFKTVFYKKYYPMYDLPVKQTIANWDYFNTLNVDRPRGVYKQNDKIHDCWPQRTFLTMSIDTIKTLSTIGGVCNMSSNWVKDINLVEYLF